VDLYAIKARPMNSVRGGSGVKLDIFLDFGGTERMRGNVHVVWMLDIRGTNIRKISLLLQLFRIG
jgi:hypothetical protein